MAASAHSLSTASSSSVTATEPDPDLEARRLARQVSHIGLVFDSAGVSPAVLGHRYPGRGTADDPYLVDFLPLDRHNPLSYPIWKKWMITTSLAFVTLAVSFCSSAFAGGITEIMEEFEASQEIAILGISLYVVGFAIGPLLWAPASEFYGRRILLLTTYMALTAFNAGAAESQSIQTLIILRFFAGSFGSSPLTNSGGVIADMFESRERGQANAIFALAPFLGPSLGPICGGFLGESKGWRWIQGLMAIFTGVIWIVCIFLVPETYTPVLLRERAAKLSKLTGQTYVSKIDADQPKKTMANQFKHALSRPWVLLFREPIVFLTSLYMAIIYGTLYMLLDAFPIVFQKQRGWSTGIGGLAFVGVTVGMNFGVLYAIWDNKRYARVLAKHNGSAPAEARLPPALIGSILLPVGLFWFAWTNGLQIHWVVPMVASGFFGSGLVLVFISLLNYLVDSYVIFAASVLAANSVLRSLFGAVFPLFTTYMYESLGIHWASSIPAFLALGCIPFPLLFYRYGAKIRAKCKFAAEAAEVLERMRTKHVAVDEDDAMEEAEKKEPSHPTEGGVLGGKEVGIYRDAVEKTLESGGTNTPYEGNEKELKEKSEVV